ncbi:MAG: FAD-dependent oxidoreductase, partial [Gammaproteobacteria bacterium]|nr:FAD-dependent oxidoreductase [Gammaproteobacteria bacterium]
VILEGGSRVGGRAHTERASLGLAFDRGCAWLHSGSINPLTALADRHGAAYARANPARRLFVEGRPATAAEAGAADAFLRAGYEAVRAAGARGEDRPVAEVTPRDHPWSPLLDYFIAAITAADVEACSTLDYTAERDTDENWPVREGLGAVIARYGRGLPVVLDAPVRRVHWGGREVEVQTADTTYRARAAIVTVSTGVLAAGMIAFDPPLPEAKRAAIEALPMGCANKVAVRFAREVTGLAPNTYAVDVVDRRRTLGFHVDPFGRPVTVAYFGGGLGAELEALGPEAMQALVIERLAGLFGQRVKRERRAATATRWNADPLVRGAYSAARPGAARARAVLAEPVGERVLFAGEAVSTEFFATAHGAFLTGVDAGRRALGLLENTSRKRRR